MILFSNSAGSSALTKLLEVKKQNHFQFNTNCSLLINNLILKQLNTSVYRNNVTFLIYIFYCQNASIEKFVPHNNESGAISVNDK